MLERNYTATSLIVSPRGDKGRYAEPSRELAMRAFLRSLYGHLVGSG
jgi:hypothetical protein